MSAHTITLSKDSLLLRFYTEVWGASRTNANFCRLFWAIVFAPVGLLFYGIDKTYHFIRGFFPARQALDDWDFEEYLKNEREKTAKRQERLNKWSDRAEKIANVFRNLWATPFRYLVFGLAALISLAVVAFVVYVIVTNIIDFLIFLAVLTGIVIVVFAIVLTAIKLDDRGTWKAIGASAKAFKHNTCPVIEVRE